MGRQLLHSRRVLLPNRPNRKSPRSPKPLQRQQRRRPGRKPHRTSTNTRASAISIRPRTYAPAGSPATASTRAISCGADALNPTNAETSVLNRAPEHRHLPQSRKLSGGVTKQDYQTCSLRRYGTLALIISRFISTKSFFTPPVFAAAKIFFQSRLSCPTGMIFFVSVDQP